MPLNVWHDVAQAVEDDVFLLDVRDTRQVLHFYAGSNTWSTKSPAPIDTSGARMIVANGDLFVAGGDVSVLARYTIATDTWLVCTPPTQRHCYGALFSREGKLYLVGGGDQQDSVEEYDAGHDTWCVCDASVPYEGKNLLAMTLDI